MVIPSSSSDNVTSFREFTLGALVWNNSGIAIHGIDSVGCLDLGTILFSE